MVLVNLKKSKSGSSLLNVQMSHLNKMSIHIPMEIILTIVK